MTAIGAALRDAGLIPDTPVRTHTPSTMGTRLKMLGMIVGEDPWVWLAVQERKAVDRMWRDAEIADGETLHSASATFEREGETVTVVFDLYDEAGLEAAARWAVNPDAPPLEYHFA